MNETAKKSLLRRDKFMPELSLLVTLVDRLLRMNKECKT